MSDEAEMTMLMYAELKPEEERTLKSIDGDVSTVLLDKGINKRAIWTSQSDTGERSIQLCIPGESQPQILFELPDGEFADLSASEIVSRLRGSLE